MSDFHHRDFHKEFYPTPSTLAYKLAGDHIGNVHSVLDPSAGKGDLLDPFLKYRVSAYGIEQNMDLCAILRSKDITVLGTDFLQYMGEHYFDLVIMNPPFSCCLDHFLHAWEVCKTRQIVSMLPRRVLHSDDAKSTHVRGLIERYGEAKELGDAFAKGERSTRVSVIAVTLHKESAGTSIFSFSPKVEEKVDDKGSVFICESGLVKRDLVSTLVGQYEGAVIAMSEMLHTVERIRYSVGSLITKCRIDEMLGACLKEESAGQSYNKFVDDLKMGCWDTLFSDGKFAKYMTSSCRKEFDEFASQNKGMAFNEENIARILESLMMSNGDIMKKNIMDVFDMLTKYHHENRAHIEGWKTNDAWKVKRKFILPFVVDYDRNFGMSARWHRSNELRDIDTAMCTITGRNVDDIYPTLSAINCGCKDGWPIESTFFRIRCYQKGTGHFEFLEEDLWDKFNRIACEGKNWLPGGEG